LTGKSAPDGTRVGARPNWKEPPPRDASLIEADANKGRSIPGSEWNKKIDPERAGRAVKEYLSTLDDAAYGAATQVVSKFVSPSDPAAQWTGALKSAAFFAYADNYLIDVKFGIIMDVEASRAIRQAEVGASQTMIERTAACFGIKPEWLVGDTAYGSAPNLDWLVNDRSLHLGDRQVEARRRHVLARGLRLRRGEGCLHLPDRQTLTTTGYICTDHAIRYLASVPDCRACQGEVLPEHACPTGRP
jgi:hypothetical protein